MSQEDSADQCPPQKMADAVEALQADDAKGLRRIAELLGEYPRDARLHFLRGSVLASLQRYNDAHTAMVAAVELQPDFDIARFQLGFLELTSGDATAAVVTWQPLEDLAADDPLRLFARGLLFLIRDDFTQSIDTLRRGMSLNRDNPNLNSDMQMIVDKIEGDSPGRGDDPETTSSAQMMLRQSATKETRH